MSKKFIDEINQFSSKTKESKIFKLTVSAKVGYEKINLSYDLNSEESELLLDDLKSIVTSEKEDTVEKDRNLPILPINSIWEAEPINKTLICDSLPDDTDPVVLVRADIKGIYIISGEERVVKICDNSATSETARMVMAKNFSKLVQVDPIEVCLKLARDLSKERALSCKSNNIEKRHSELKISFMEIARERDLLKKAVVTNFIKVNGS